MRVQQLIPKDISGKEFFVQTLVESVGTIAAAFYPRPVKVCLSDFKSNEYSSLLGGKQFEPDEENPMLGFRGASRYTHPYYNEVFELECRAIQSIVYNLGLTNLILLIPFCRSMDEAHKVKDTISIHGVIRLSVTDSSGIKVYMMCGIPSITTALIDIDQFASLFDGFMLGSYDHNLLLRLRDDQKHCEIILPDIFDERNPIVFRHIELIIESIRRNKKNVSICGDELSSSCPEMIDTLIRLGVDSLSVGVNNFMKTLLIVQRYEIVTLSDLNKVG
jgi:pyruvate,water dikinase